MAFLNNAIVRHGELSLALRHTAVAIGGGHKATLVDIWADKDELAIATADIESRVPFRGEWTVRVSVSSEMLRRLVAKQPGASRCC